MLRFSAILLFISSCFLLILLLVCQGGPDWEVPQGSIAVMELSSACAVLFMILGTITFLIKVNTFIEIKSRGKFLFIIWYFIVLAAFGVIIKNGEPVDAFRFSSVAMQETVGLFKLLGLFISVTFLISLFITFGRKKT